MQQIGRYQIVKELGRGAMGVVYRALDPAIGRTIAIKSIRLADLTEPAEREKMKERLLREAQSAGILSHPGIVTIYDIADDGERAYIFMEFVDGPTLEQLLSMETPPEKDKLLHMMRQMAAALDYAHHKGIIHRDIKPANIMINEDGAVKITDFGVAKIASQQMTQAGTMLGTPNYMSPEQIQGIPLDGRSDQFALGVVAYELLTGDKPFVADSLPSLLYRIVKEEPIPPKRLNPSLGEEIEEAIHKALAKKPDDRYVTCEEFVAALRGACARVPGWQPLPRGSSQSMATVAATSIPPPPPRPLPAEPPEAAPPSPVERRRRERDEQESSPLVRNALLVAAGVAMVGLAVVGGQRFLGREVADATPVEREAIPTPPPAPVPASAESLTQPDAEPPKPSPIGQPAEIEPAPPAPRPSSPPAPTELEVAFTTAPAGATIEVDNLAELRCQSPCSLVLTPGRHTLSATLAGHRRAIRIFQVPDDGPLQMQLEAQSGTLMLSSQPSGASIYVDGQLRPEKTPAMLSLPAGHHRITVIKDGHSKFEDTIEIKDKVIANLDVSF